MPPLDGVSDSEFAPPEPAPAGAQEFAPVKPPPIGATPFAEPKPPPSGSVPINPNAVVYTRDKPFTPPKGATQEQVDAYFGLPPGSHIQTPKGISVVPAPKPEDAAASVDAATGLPLDYSGYPETPKGPSMLGSAARGAAMGVVPAATGIVGMGVGAEIGGALGALGGPLAPITVPAGAIIGGASGALFGGYLGGKAQEKVIEHLPEKTREAIQKSQAEDIATNPRSYQIGQILPNVAAFTPGTAVGTVGQRVLQHGLGAGLMGGQELGMQAVEGKPIDWPSVGIATGAGAAMVHPTAIGRALTGVGAAPVRRMGIRSPVSPLAEPPTSEPPTVEPTTPPLGAVPLLAIPPPETIYGPGEPQVGPGMATGPSGEPLRGGRPAFTMEPPVPGAEPAPAAEAESGTRLYFRPEDLPVAETPPPAGVAPAAEAAPAEGAARPAVPQEAAAPAEAVAPPPARPITPEEASAAGRAALTEQATPAGEAALGERLQAVGAELRGEQPPVPTAAAPEVSGEAPVTPQASVMGVAEPPRQPEARVERPVAGTEAPPAGGIHDLRDEYEQHRASTADMHQAARDWTLEQGRASGHEHLVAQSGDQTLAAYTGSLPRAVPFSPELLRALDDPGAGSVIHHNHPGDAALSGQDIKQLALPGLDTLVGHAHNGDIFSARLTPEAEMWAASYPDGAAGVIDTLYHNAAEPVVRRRLQGMLDQGKITPEQADLLHADLVNRALDAAGLTDYVSTRSIEPLKDFWTKNLIREAASRVRRVADAYGVPELSQEDFDARVHRSTLAVRPEAAMAGLPRADSGEAAAGRPGRDQGAGERGEGAGEPAGLAEAAPGGGGGREPPREPPAPPPEGPEADAERAALNRIMHTNNESLWDRAKAFVADIRTDTATRFKQGFLDDLAGLEAALKRSGGAGWQTIKSMPLNMARLTRNLDSVMATVIGVRHGGDYVGGALQYDPRTGAFSTAPNTKPFAAVFKPIFDRGLQDQWALWAIVNRAKRLMAEGREHNVSPEDIARYENLDRKYTLPDSTNLFRQALNDWRDLNRRTLDMAEATGLLNADQRALFEHDDYVPFFRAIEEGAVAGATKAGGKGIANIRSGIKRLTGGEEKVNNIYENMVRNLTALTDRSMKNAAMREVVAELSGTDALTPMSKMARENLQTPENRARLEAMGLDPARMSAQAKAAAVDLFGMMKKQDPELVSFMDSGKPQFFQVNDPLLLRSLISMGPDPTRGIVENLLGAAKKVLTHSVTIDPAFMVANLLRDSVHSWVVTGHGFTPGVDTMKGFVSSLRNDPSAMALMAGGAGGGHFYAVAPESVRRLMQRPDFKESVLDTPRKLWKAMERIGAASEQANRIAIYNDAIKEGATPLEALARAQDMLNFSMRGDQAAMRFLTETVPFMNARIQGLYRLYRGARDNPSSFLLRGGLFAAGAIALWAANHDDERYKALEDWDRQNYLHFFIGDGHYRLPMPFEVGALFGSIPEMLLNYSENGRLKEVRNAFVSMVSNQLNMNPIPQLLKPAVDLYANKDSFTGRPIVSPGEERLTAPLQYGPTTSQTAVQLAGSLGVSPDQAEYLLRGYGGTLATYMLAASDAMLDATGVTPPRATRRWDQTPLVSRFVREEPALSSRWLTEFYDLKQDADKLVASVKKYQQLGDAKGAQAILADQENLRKIGIDKGAGHVAKQLSNLRRAMVQIEASRTMSPDEKRQRLDSLLTARNRLAGAVAPPMIQNVEQLSARP